MNDEDIHLCFLRKKSDWQWFKTIASFTAIYNVESCNKKMNFPQNSQNFSPSWVKSQAYFQVQTKYIQFSSVLSYMQYHVIVN